MPPKKAAKKAAKRAAQKHPKHHGKEHHEGKDIRRMYEHLGRLSALQRALAPEVVARIKRITELAQSSLIAGAQKSAADLLRACEHLAFGSLAATARASGLSEELNAAINAEYEHLVDKAEDHWDKHSGRRPAEIEPVYEAMLGAAQSAFKKGAFRRALEYARGAEALAHVHGDVSGDVSGDIEPALIRDDGRKKTKRRDALAAKGAGKSSKSHSVKRSRS